MNSPFAKAYESIMARITAEVPEIKYLDRNLGQLEGYVKRPEIAFPGILINFENWTYTNMGDNAQMAEGDVVVLMAFARHLQSNNLTPSAWREVALEYDEIAWKVNTVLHGWSPGDEFGYLTRRSSTGINSPMAVRLEPIRYRLEFEDYSARPVRTKSGLPTAFDISIQNADT